MAQQSGAWSSSTSARNSAHLGQGLCSLAFAFLVRTREPEPLAHSARPSYSSMSWPSPRSSQEASCSSLVHFLRPLNTATRANRHVPACQLEPIGDGASRRRLHSELMGKSATVNTNRSMVPCMPCISQTRSMVFQSPTLWLQPFPLPRIPSLSVRLFSTVTFLKKLG